MEFKVNREGVVVDHAYYYQPIETCPRGSKVLLLTAGEVAVIGHYSGNPDHYLGWAPLPKIRRATSDDEGLGF